MVAEPLVVMVLFIAGLWAVVSAPWRELRLRSDCQHGFYASLLLLPVLWMGGVNVSDGIVVHLMGITALLMIFGWQIALLLGYAAAVILGGFGFWEWTQIPVELLLSVLTPLLITQGLLTLANRLPQANLFVYLLGVAFLGGFLSMVASLLLGAAVLDWSADHAVVLLLAFPEGFIAGAIVTALTLFYPSIMRTYDDERYLGEP